MNEQREPSGDDLWDSRLDGLAHEQPWNDHPGAKLAAWKERNARFTRKTSSWWMRQARHYAELEEQKLSGRGHPPSGGQVIPSPDPCPGQIPLPVPDPGQASSPNPQGEDTKAPVGTGD